MKVSDLNFDPKEVMKQVKARKAHTPLMRVSRPHKDKTQYNRKQTKRDFWKSLQETRVLSGVHLTDHQKSVMSIVAYSGEKPSTVADIVAGVDPNNKQNMASAVTTLTQIGLLTIPENGEDGELTLSDQGMKAMQDSNLVDTSGALTQDGEASRTKFATDTNGKTQADVGQEMSFQEEPPMGGMDMGGGVDMGGMGMPESHSFIGMLVSGKLS